MEIDIIETKVKNVSQLKDKISRSPSKKITSLLEIILGGAISLDVSDIHIEPQKDEAKIRLRIDGLLQDLISINSGDYQGLLSRIKLLSGIMLNITDRPQNGRFSVSLPEYPVEIRVSTLPAEKGETVVMRILNPKSLVTIDVLGLRNDLLATFKREIKRPNGMIIVTGPTGSGKTTTLYAFLKEIQRPEIKIITIEDPIEYHLKGISQTQTAPQKGYDFASGLKALMRQDPDVILVGEIRDLETANIAIQAALTGHLVLTTLHTNDAAGTVARLTNLGVNPSNVGAALNLAIAQRLVRKVCKKCSEFKKPSAESLKKLKKALKKIPKKLKIAHARGCRDCNFTGYRGRVGVFEAFLMDGEMEKFILKNPSIAALREKLAQKGMLSMRQDGFIKVLEGITTIEEVERVAGQEAES
ncbi:MAG TPA: type II/IV secretion system protein [Calditrichaeota bacterium]|nr:type II/IV secretion system protein [Calditrichota bacterium]